MPADKKAEAFCLSDLKKQAWYLSHITGELPAARRRYDRYSAAGDGKKATEALVELKKLAERLWSVLLTVVQLLNEASEHELAEKVKRFREMLLHYDYLGVAAYDSLCEALKALVAQIRPPEEDNINRAKLGRLMNHVMAGYYPTDLDHVERLQRAIAFPEDTSVNILDPCCGEGLALSRLCAGQNAFSYGVEIDGTRAEAALNRLTRVGFGSYFFSRISHNVFHCLFLNPPYLSVPTEHGTRRLEKAFLADSLRHLMSGGLLIYIIPYYRLTDDVASVLTSNFADLQVYRFLPNEFSRFKQIVIVGKRKEYENRPDLIEGLVMQSVEPDLIPEITELPERCLHLPEKQQDIPLFKGSEFNVRELAVQMHQSDHLKALFRASALDSRDRRPPLPLKISHMGLIGASGFLNGYVPGESPHVVKGRIVRETKTYFDVDAEEMVKTTTNRMIFNCLTPDGLKSLK